MCDDERTDIPRLTIDRELDQAERMLKDATTAHEVDISKATVVNRLYYACFHAAQAALYDHGFDPQSHGGVQMLLGRELVRTGEVSRELGRFFNEMETYRRRVDYGSGDVERDSEELIQRTATFLSEMRQLTRADESK